MSDTADAIAAFLAKGGAVRKLATGANSGITDRQFYLAARDTVNVRVIEQEDIDAAISEREHELGAAFGVEGVNDFRLGVAKHGAKAMLGWE